MRIADLKELTLKSAKTYYDYLAKNDLGLEYIEVVMIEEARAQERVYLFKTRKRIIDPETLRIYDSSQGVWYEPETDFEIESYEEEKNILTIKILNLGLNVNKIHDLRTIKLVSDLKFLVKNIEIWFGSNGDDLGLPKFAELPCKKEKRKFLEDKKPSQNQEFAIETTLNNPLSYVWGAPGTGKTEFVLSYSILHYLQKNKRIAIFAPTHNALEQVLRGVVKMTDKLDIPREDIFRVGMPSKSFLEEYPELCEIHGKGFQEERQKMFQERMKSAKIIAMTLDRYVSYAQDLNVNHFFCG